MIESVHFMSKRSDWATPQDLFDKLNEEFNSQGNFINKEYFVCNWCFYYVWSIF